MNLPNRTDSQSSIGRSLADSSISRRTFLRFCSSLAAVASAELALTRNASAREIAQRLTLAHRPSVIWLQLADCTGCTGSLLHAYDPDVAELLFSLVSLDYHETLMAGAGQQAEEALQHAIDANRGAFVLVVEGAIPVGSRAGYARIAGRNALDIVRATAEHAAFVVAMGSCAAWGGVASAHPNPCEAAPLDTLLANTRVINLPGCPPNPYTLLAVLLEHAAMHRLPALDSAGRPRFAYDRLIHDDCPRRGHFDAGRFASVYGDEGHRNGWCLYKLGCKGPQTHAACSTRHFNGPANAWPIGIGAPCIGCTEQKVAFRVPLFQLADIHAATPAEAFPPVDEPAHKSETAAAVAIGALAGAAGSAAWFASRRLPGAQASSDLDELEELEKQQSPAESEEDPDDSDTERR